MADHTRPRPLLSPVRILPITIYLLHFISLLVFVSEPRAQITQIQVNVVTPDISGAATDASIFLGIGGREFTLDGRDRNDFQQNSENTFIFGANSNVARPRIAKILKQPLSLCLRDDLSTPSPCRPFLLRPIHWTPH